MLFRSTAFLDLYAKVDATATGTPDVETAPETPVVEASAPMDDIPF